MATTLDVLTSGAALPEDRGVGDVSTRSTFGTLGWLYSAGFALGGLVVGSRPLHDNSFFVHLATGRWIVDHGAVPHHDVYSFSAPGVRFVAQSWLAELAYGALERSVGAGYIRLLMGCVAAAVAVAVFRLALRLTGALYRAVGIALVAFTVIGAMYSERPLAFGLLALVGVVWIVEVPDSRIGRRPILTLPAVLWCWGNVHGSMALGFAYLALHLVGRTIEGARPWRAGRERDIAIGTLVGAAVLCVNPYGPQLLWFPVELLGRGKVLADVVEWMSPDFHSVAGMAFAAWLVVTVVVCAFGVRPSRRDVVVALPFVLLALWALRNLAVCVIVLVPVVARSAAVHDGRAPHEHRTTVGRFVAALLVVAMSAVGLGALRSPAFDQRSYSRAAMNWLVDHHALGLHMFTTDANAGWVIAAYWPRQHVYMDDRYDMYPIALMEDYQKVASVQPEWQSLLDRYRIDVVVWPTNRSLSQALRASSSRWTRVEHDSAWSVFVRLSD